MSITEDAKKAYDKLHENDENFPFLQCKIAALVMHDLGYVIMHGTVHLDNYRNSGTRCDMDHYWNRDRSGMEVDITASQFNRHIKNHVLPEIAVWKPEERPPFYEVLEMRVDLKDFF